MAGNKNKGPTKRGPGYWNTVKTKFRKTFWTTLGLFLLEAAVIALWISGILKQWGVFNFLKESADFAFSGKVFAQALPIFIAVLLVPLAIRGLYSAFRVFDGKGRKWAKTRVGITGGLLLGSMVLLVLSLTTSRLPDFFNPVFAIGLCAANFLLVVGAIGFLAKKRQIEIIHQTDMNEKQKLLVENAYNNPNIKNKTITPMQKQADPSKIKGGRTLDWELYLNKESTINPNTLISSNSDKNNKKPIEQSNKDDDIGIEQHVPKPEQETNGNNNPPTNDV